MSASTLALVNRQSLSSRPATAMVISSKALDLLFGGSKHSSKLLDKLGMSEKEYALFTQTKLTKNGRQGGGGGEGGYTPNAQEEGSIAVGRIRSASPPHQFSLKEGKESVRSSRLANKSSGKAAKVLGIEGAYNSRHSVVMNLQDDEEEEDNKKNKKLDRREDSPSPTRSFNHSQLSKKALSLLYGGGPYSPPIPKGGEESGGGAPTSRESNLDDLDKNSKSRRGTRRFSIKGAGRLGVSEKELEMFYDHPKAHLQLGVGIQSQQSNAQGGTTERGQGKGKAALRLLQKTVMNHLQEERERARPTTAAAQNFRPAEKMTEFRPATSSVDPSTSSLTSPQTLSRQVSSVQLMSETSIFNSSHSRNTSSTCSTGGRPPLLKRAASTQQLIPSTILNNPATTFSSTVSHLSSINLRNASSFDIASPSSYASRPAAVRLQRMSSRMALNTALEEFTTPTLTAEAIITPTNGTFKSLIKKHRLPKLIRQSTLPALVEGAADTAITSSHSPSHSNSQSRNNNMQSNQNEKLATSTSTFLSATVSSSVAILPKSPRTKSKSKQLAATAKIIGKISSLRRLSVQQRQDQSTDNGVHQQQLPLAMPRGSSVPSLLELQISGKALRAPPSSNLLLSS